MRIFYYLCSCWSLGYGWIGKCLRLTAVPSVCEIQLTSEIKNEKNLAKIALKHLTNDTEKSVKTIAFMVLEMGRGADVIVNVGWQRKRKNKPVWR